MFKKLCDMLLGGNSKRYQMMVIYTVIFIVISLAGQMNAIAFATFTGLFGAWLGFDTLRKS